MSLVENLAAAKQTTVEMAREIQALKKRGYSGAEIGIKVGLSETYVSNLLRLLQNGEERLIDAVERGEIPMAVATEIAASSDEAFQHSLHEAYASGKLRGRALLKVRRLVEVRSVRGKALRGGSQQTEASIGSGSRPYVPTRDGPAGTFSEEGASL